jgi:Lon protease-like protein
VDLATLRDICRTLPIFPLPRTVLMPGAVLPLHVFEPRYRALVADCLGSHHVMGVATLRPGYEPDYHGAPAVWSDVGVGQVVSHQPFPDGRSNIVLQYVGRVRIVRELPTASLYRVVEGEVVEDDERGLDDAVRALKVLVLQLGAVTPEATGEARRLVSLEGAELVDALARRLFVDPDDQRVYLGAARISDRVTLVQDRLAAYMVATNTSGASEA